DHGTDSLNIEISGSGPMTATTMKLAHPDRVVVDIPNSQLQGRAREIAVNSGDVKSVRVGRFDAGVTRIVLDMPQMREFQVVPEGNKLVVKLQDGDNGTKPVPLPETKVSVAAAAANPQPASQNSQTALVAPAASKTESKIVEATPSRAEVAASHFAHD